MHARAVLRLDDDRASRPALLRAPLDKLRTARGFVIGSALSGALWSMIVLLAWCVAA